MIAPGIFRAVRRFYMDGKLVEVGTMLELADNELIGDLMNGQRIEPADAATMERVHCEATLAFQEAGGVSRHGVAKDDTRRVSHLGLVANRK